MASFTKEILTETVPISGLMVSNLPEATSTISCKVPASSPGKTAETTVETTKMTKKVDTESSNGLTVENTKVIGITENNTEKASTSTQMASREKDTGTKAKENNG